MGSTLDPGGSSLGFEFQERDSDGFTISLKSRDPQRKSPSELILRDRKPKSKKTPLAGRQWVSLLMGLEPRHDRPVALREHDSLIEIRRCVAYSGDQKGDVWRRKGQVAAIRLKFDANSAAVILAGLQAEHTNSRDLNCNTLTCEDVAIWGCKNAKFVNAAAF